MRDDAFQFRPRRTQRLEIGARPAQLGHRVERALQCLRGTQQGGVAAQAADHLQAEGHALLVAPDVPTLAESGLPGYELSSWQAVFAPAGTPKPIVDRLYAEISKILQMPDVQKRLTDLGLDLSGMPPQQLEALVKADVPRLGKIVKESGAKAE